MPDSHFPEPDADGRLHVTREELITALIIQARVHAPEKLWLAAARDNNPDARKRRSTAEREAAQRELFTLAVDQAVVRAGWTVTRPVPPVPGQWASVLMPGREG